MSGMSGAASASGSRNRPRRADDDLSRTPMGKRRGGRRLGDGERLPPRRMCGGGERLLMRIEGGEGERP